MPSLSPAKSNGATADSVTDCPQNVPLVHTIALVWIELVPGLFANYWCMLTPIRSFKPMISRLISSLMKS